MTEVVWYLRLFLRVFSIVSAFVAALQAGLEHVSIALMMLSLAVASAFVIGLVDSGDWKRP
jgi:hypothetical protein